MAVAASLCAGTAHAQAPSPADTRAVFDLPPPQTAPAAPAEDPRAAFGLAAPGPAAPADCSDGRAFDCAGPSDALDGATPYALSTWLPADYLLRLPVGDARHDAVAGYALGAGSDDVGLIFGGGSGLENRWTIDGAPADSVRTGAADTRLPLGFLAGIAVSAGGFSARDRASTGGTVDARLVRGTASHQLRVDAYGQLFRSPGERPIASGSYTVRRATGTPGPAASLSLVATGPITAHTWYAAGVAPQLTTLDVTWHASRVLDDDGDGLPDGLPGPVALAPIETTRERSYRSSVPLLARAGLDHGAHHVDVSLVGTIDHDTAFTALATQQASGVDRSTVTGDAIATWRGEWARTRARVQLAWHRSVRSESAHDRAAAALPQLLSAYIPDGLNDDPALAAACRDGVPGDLAPTVANCPVPFGFFASGGAGELVDTTADRPSVTAELAHRLGGHVLRAGATLEDSHLTTTQRYTGGEEDRTLFVGELGRRRFTTGACDDDAPSCNYIDAARLSYRTLYAAAFVEDTYALDSVTLDAGVRWELMWVGSRLHFSNQLSPRVGITWDPLGAGRSRVWASYGRTFAMLPAVLGQTVIERAATADDFELSGMNGRAHDSGAVFGVAPGTEAIHQDEITAGAEVALVGALRATLWGQARWLRDGLETVGGVFGNPDEPAALRRTQLIAAQLEMREHARTTIRAGVVYGRTRGTWSGFYDPRTGLTALDTPDFDRSTSNLDGPLATQIGGQAFVEAERRGAFGDVAVAIATRLAVASGRVRDVQADGVTGDVELLPRGAGEASALVAQANARLSASWHGYTATLDVMNVFDRRTVTGTDELYTVDGVRPIEGGAAADLVFLKTDAGRNATRRTAYQLPVAYQPPLSVTLGLHKTF